MENSDAATVCVKCQQPKAKGELDSRSRRYAGVCRACRRASVAEFRSTKMGYFRSQLDKIGRVPRRRDRIAATEKDLCDIWDAQGGDPDPTGGENNVAWSGDNNSFGFSVNDRSVTYPPRMDAGVDKAYVVKAPDGDESAFRRITQGDGKCMFNALLIVDAFRKGETVTSEQVVQRTRALKEESSEPGEGGWGDPSGCRLGARWGARSPHSGPPPRKWQSPEGGRQSNSTAKKKRPEYGDKEVAQ
eukprot:jgi/Mesvir1/21826/Mv04211-RA.1